MIILSFDVVWLFQIATEERVICVKIVLIYLLAV